MHRPPDETPEDSSPLERLLAREARKLESALVLRRAASKRRGEAPTSVADPVGPEYDGLVPAAEAPVAEWIEERLEFVRFAQRALQCASPAEKAHFWLGASCSFVGAVPHLGVGIRALEERVRAAEEHYREVARVTGGEEDLGRVREEPWDGSAGLIPRRRLRGASILAEALELLAEQREAMEDLEERAPRD